MTEEEKAQVAALLEKAADVAWLIERGGQCLGFCEYKLAWVTFTNEDALRFSRQRDAYSFMESFKWKPEWLHLEGAIVTEHSWSNAIPADYAAALAERVAAAVEEAYTIKGGVCPCCQNDLNARVDRELKIQAAARLAAVDAAVDECARHAQFCKTEALNGGDVQHLMARYEEAAYLAERIRATAEKAKVNP